MEQIWPICTDHMNIWKSLNAHNNSVHFSKRSPVTAGAPQTISAAPLVQTLNYNIPFYNAAAAVPYIPTVYQTPLGSPEPVVATVGNPLVRQVAGNPVFQIGFQEKIYL